NLNTGKLCKQ
ncbi:unnamed protein product, partial [Fusarium langsethiae]